MKVCFVKLDGPYLEYPSSDPPLGLLYVVAAVEAAGHDVGFVDLDWMGMDSIPKADVYGISATSFEYSRACSVAQCIRAKFSGVKLVLGGIHSSLFGEELKDQSIFDIVYMGEGEEFPQLLEFLERGAKISLYRAGVTKDLDIISLPARHFLRRKQYFNAPTVFRGERFRDGSSTTILASRGCPYACAFCASPNLWKRRVRWRSVDCVLEEVDVLVNSYGISELRFQDDNMTLKGSWLAGICNGLRERQVYWRCSTRSDLIDLSSLSLLWNGGCREIGIGIESVEDSVLSLIRKGVTAKVQIDGVKHAKEFGFRVRVFLMTGLPGETEHSADRTIDFLEDTAPDVVTLTTFVPIPGSEIYRVPEKFGGRILDNNFSNYDFSLKWERGIPFVFSNGLTPEQMEVNREKLKAYIFNRGISNVFSYNRAYQ